MTGLWNLEEDWDDDIRDDDLYEKEDLELDLDIDLDADEDDIICIECGAIVEDGVQCPICGLVIGV